MHSAPSHRLSNAPPPRRHHRLVGCCVKQSSSGHSRPVLRPSRNIQMGAISAPQRRGPNVVRASPDAGRHHQACGELRRHDLDAWRMSSRRGRAKPLGVRVRSGSSCVLCWVCSVVCVWRAESYMRAWYCLLGDSLSPYSCTHTKKISTYVLTIP